MTIAASPIFTPMFVRYCAMMRRTDLLSDPRFATAQLRRLNLKFLLAEVRAWILTFGDLDELQAQVSEAGLAIGLVRTTQQFAESEWARECSRGGRERPRRRDGTHARPAVAV